MARNELRALTLTLLLIIPVVVSHSATQENQPAGGGGQTMSRCDVDAYVIDPDPKGMNVRSGPGGTFKIIGNLPKQDVEAISVHITGSQGDWVRIDLAVEEGGEQERTFFKGQGWLYGPLLGVDGIGSGTKLYQRATLKSKVVGKLPGGSDGAIVRGCQGKWMYVEYKKQRAWAAPNTLCTNPLTTCP